MEICSEMYHIYGNHLMLEVYMEVLPSVSYPGNVIAQSLLAAMNTVSTDLYIHSCHCYFILGGDSTTPIYYMVERVRDGRV